ncbi:hypothetical protein [Nocardiopsis baichengensis]|uniref:hypothetical protein n=1 Tax=Nocardiopsis baichengensis TaxID=280240 RepID=UPI0012685BF7|nr:hypothetical protein [Nocardiopsis baichengensis]
MSGHEVGVNATDAYGKGADAAEYASDFKGLSSDFEELIGTDAPAACGKTPGVSGWSSYASEQQASMENVEKQGISLGENIQAGAGEAKDVDSENAEAMDGSTGGVSRPINE